MSGVQSDLPALSQKLAVAFLEPLDQIVAKQETASTLQEAAPSAEARGYFAQGVSYEQQGKYEQAVELFTKALSAARHYEEARAHLEHASEAAARQ